MTSTNVVSLKAGGPIAGIIPTSIEEVFRLSNAIKLSGLAPASLNTAEKITVAILTGLEVGLPPMFALSKIAVINGRPALWGDALPALLWSRGFKLREWIAGSAGSTRCAFCEITRPDGTKIERAFSEADAVTAGLWNKGGPWKQYPERMLTMRARGFAARDGAADVLGGLYVAEELDEPMRDVTPRKAIAELPDIPDVPDIPDAVDELPPDDDVIADPAGFVEHYRDQYAEANADERKEIVESNAEIVERLPEQYRREIASIISEAA